MPGLFGALDLGSRSLQTQRQGVEVAGQNLANVNNPAYARQRVVIQAGLSLPTGIGPEGTGANAVAIQQLRDSLVDSQIQTETSVTGFWSAQQRALQYAQASLGQELNTQASTTATSGAGSGLAGDLSDLFSGFQSLSAAPASTAGRQTLLAEAQTLATRFNQTDQRLGSLKGQLNDALNTDISKANQLLGDIAGLNNQIVRAEAGSGGVANDLRDLRQQKIEDLSALVKVETTRTSTGAVDLAIGGNVLVSGKQVLDAFQIYDAGGGLLLVRAANSGTPLTLTGGSAQGAIDARDGAVATLRNNLTTLASALISQVNSIHSGGFNLSGGTGALFFTGTGAADIQVNRALVSDPSLVQASGNAGAAGDNQVALALAQLADKKQATLNNQTYTDTYSQNVGALGNALATANGQVSDQKAVQNMLLRQRDSVSGVSLDEEMADLVKFQKAFEASARLVTTVSDMLEEVVNLKR